MDIHFTPVRNEGEKSTIEVFIYFCANLTCVSIALKSYDVSF